MFIVQSLTFLLTANRQAYPVVFTTAFSIYHHCSFYSFNCALVFILTVVYAATVKCSSAFLFRDSRKAKSKANCKWYGILEFNVPLDTV